MLMLRNVIATRTFTRRIPSGSPQLDSKIEVKIGKPVDCKDTINRRWKCQYQVTGLESDVIRNAYGADSVQALYLALVAVGIHLSNSIRINDLSSEMSDVEANFGFPVLISIPPNTDIEPLSR